MAQALSEDLYAFAFESAKKAINIVNLGVPWESYRNYITPETIRALKTCSQLTPVQEEWVPSSDLRELTEDLRAFEQSVKDSALPEKVVSFIFRQIAVLERAILEADIIGMRAFTRGIAAFSAELQNDRDLAEQYTDEPEVRRLARCWRKFVDIASQFVTLGNAVETSRKMAEIGGDVVDKMSQ